ncbi:MAG: 5'-3' exonuclease [Micrococcales bacterium]|nr:5'-3' exonuclease [Micrococcales bacterium]
MTDRLMLLDTAALYFRAFHGVPESVVDPRGQPVNAVRGLLDIIAKLLTEYRPARIVAAWDDDWRPAWRVELIPSYKAHRVAAEPAPGESVEVVPDLLTPQIAIIREVLDALGIPVVGAPGCEADDVIGTLCARADGPVDVVTGDRDLYQLVDDARGIRVISTIKGMRNLEVVTADVVRAKYGVGPEHYADFATLRGDTSDGLPGVAGVGEKTAAGLVGEYGGVDRILAAAADPGSGMSAAVRAKLAAAADYLAVAPRVVRVLADAELPPVGNDAVRRVAGERAERFAALTEEHGLGGSAERILRALGDAG